MMVYIQQRCILLCGILFSHEKGRHPSVWDNMGGHRRLPAMPDRDREMLCDFICVWTLKQPDSRRENGGEQGATGGRNRGEGQRAQTLCYERSEFWALPHGTVVTAGDTVSRTRRLLRVSPKCPQHKREMAIASHNAGSS